jgi:hypothetical protein
VTPGRAVVLRFAAGAPIARSVTNRSARRYGWALLAVAVAVGGALAVRSRKRAGSTRPAPPGFMPAPVGPSAAERSLVRMAMAAAAVVVLAIVTVLVTKPADDWPVTSSLTGPGGTRVEITARRELGPLAFGTLDDRSALLHVRVRNTGTVPVSARVARDGNSVRAADGGRYPAVASDGGDPWIRPGEQFEVLVAARIPSGTRLTRLSLAVDLGGGAQAVKLGL